MVSEAEETVGHFHSRRCIVDGSADLSRSPQRAGLLCNMPPRTAVMHSLWRSHFSMTISIPNHSKMTDGTSMTKAYQKKKKSNNNLLDV